MRSKKGGHYEVVFQKANDGGSRISATVDYN